MDYQESIRVSDSQLQSSVLRNSFSVVRIFSPENSEVHEDKKTSTEIVVPSNNMAEIENDLIKAFIATIHEFRKKCNLYLLFSTLK